jgi:hypothetical protein
MRAGQQVEGLATALGLAASLALHLALFAYVASRTAQFDFDFALTLPTEVEFGVTEGSELVVASNPAPTPDATPEPRPKPTQTGTQTRKPKPTPPPKPKPERTREPRPNPVAAPATEGPSRLPPGAQLALRIDLARVRESPLGPDVTRFLSAVPDWQLLLDGSGIDPVADLDRLMVATPNLERSKLVLAGKHRRDRGFARTSVSRLARSRGKTAAWQSRFGVPTAAWHNRDRTPRTIALLSDQHFSITRRQDLKRVLALAQTRELRDAEREGLVVARGPDALLSMGPGEALSLEVEGVHRFVIGNVKHVPLRLRIAVSETGPNEATVRALATYATPEDAEAAAEYWQRVATHYSEQLILALAGFGKTLRRMDLETDDERVRVTFKLNADQIRFILSYAEGRLQGSGGATR